MRWAFNLFLPTCAILRLRSIVTLFLVVLLALPMVRVHAAPLYFAVLDFPAVSVVHVAFAQNYFQQEGLDVRPVPVPTGQQALKLLQEGKVQLGVSGDLPLVVASLEGLQFDILATIANSSAHGLYARSDRGIRQPKDLQGKRIGIIEGTTSHYYAESTLFFYGINPDAVKWVPLTTLQVVTAVARGEVDAAALFEPFRQIALSNMGAAAVSIKDPKVYTVTLNLFSARQLQDGDIQKVLRALIKAADFIEKNPTLSQSLVTKRIRLAPDLMARSWDDYQFTVELRQPLIQTLESQARWVLEKKMAPQSVAMPNYLDFIRTAPLRSIAPTEVDVFQ
jgi:ABC-type nitrate/sulfonate/bicarbonate transport system substrate-binding protein